MRNYCQKCGKRLTTKNVKWFTPKDMLMVDDPTQYGVCPHGKFFMWHCFGGTKMIDKPKWFKDEMLKDAGDSFRSFN